MLRPDSAKLRTRKSYIAWAVAGYVKGYGLSTEDARACAEIDWGLCLEAQAEAARPPAERLGKVLERKRTRKVQEMFNSPITRPDQRPPRKEAEDHRGNKYPSIKAMCKAYGIRDATWRSRRRAGWSVERALETPEYPKSIPARDADGNCYKSIKAMAEAYGLPRSTLNARLNRGMALEMALKAPVMGKEEGK